MSQIFEGPIESLSVDQRLDLIDRLWTSLDPNTARLEWPEWHREELKLRIAEADSHPESSMPLDEFRREMLARRS